MATERDLLDFHKGEDLLFTIDAKERDGTDLDDPDNATITMTIGETPDGSALLEVEGSPQVTQITAGDSIYQILVRPNDISSLTENVRYYYNIWAIDSGGNVTLQARGKLRLRNSIIYT